MKFTFSSLLIVFIWGLPFGILSQKSEIMLNDTTKIDSVQLLSYKGDQITTIRLNDRLKVKIYPEKDTIFENIQVYYEGVSFSKLKAVANEKNVYSFYAGNITEAGDTISKEFKRENKDRISIELMLKIDDNDVFKLQKLEIIYDYHKKKRKIWAWVTIIVLVIITILIFRKKELNLLKDQSDKKKDAPYSLARTQLTFWTLIITIAYFISWFKTGEQISITTQVLILLGISAGTTLTARLIDNHDIQNNPKRHQNNPSSGFLIDILSDQQGLSIHRFQNVIFTIIIGSYFLYKVSVSNVFPDIEENLLVLMGISSGTYLVIKQNENKGEKVS